MKTIFDAGKYGEYLTYKKLKEYESDGGKFLFNCYIPKEDGKTTEIDVLLIHSTGIFVIESKNYSGWIFGSENSKTWTQTLRRGNGKVRKEHFYNPIMQNNTHVKWLKEIVGTNIPIYSLIAFSERCTLKDITVESSDVVVINRQDISESVKHMGNRSIQALSKMDISRIQEMLYPYTQTTEYEKQQHIENIKNRKSVENTAQENATNQNSNQICPRCGAELVLRTAKKGEHSGEQFYGCSRFPKCRYTTYNVNK
ncbi:MAG: DNA-binding protein [Lachnospiraceae bacterium]|nr:DNA-binding protein [Lachnospiraceae bacterium]